MRIKLVIIESKLNNNLVTIHGRGPPSNMSCIECIARDTLDRKNRMLLEEDMASLFNYSMFDSNSNTWRSNSKKTLGKTVIHFDFLFHDN